MVLTLFSKYRNNVSRYKVISVTLNRLNSDLHKALSEMVEEMASIQAQQITGMPHGSGISNPTERVALELAEGRETEEVKSLRLKIEQLNNERTELEYNIQYVEAWLAGLTERERLIIEASCIDGESWYNVMRRYQQVYGIEISKSTIRRMKATALGKIYSIIE